MGPQVRVQRIYLANDYWNTPSLTQVSIEGHVPKELKVVSSRKVVLGRSNRTLTNSSLPVPSTALVRRCTNADNAFDARPWRGAISCAIDELENLSVAVDIT